MKSDQRELSEIYADAIYTVFDSSEKIEFRIGVISTPLDRLLARRQATEFAFITAQNPYSKKLSRTENAARQCKLEKMLHKSGYIFLKGCGTDIGKIWEPEASALILNIDKACAVRIGRKFEQNAVVCGKINNGAEIIWCRISE